MHELPLQFRQAAPPFKEGTKGWVTNKAFFQNKLAPFVNCQCLRCSLSVLDRRVHPFARAVPLRR